MVSFLTSPVQACTVEFFPIRTSLDSDWACGELRFTPYLEPSNTELIHDCRLLQPQFLKRKSRI